ncbi:uncharacterized protein LOC103524500 [Diaphorina citri]|uniref:Uncharacterized protein LOC103524500 n=1 Tax=Diaphorina citri TaxID=121845 RepID=A0A1S3DTL8_DIACI|nr:uncharacterized protein LOC103524500 [Diaphorina citri]
MKIIFPVILKIIFLLGSLKIIFLALLKIIFPLGMMKIIFPALLKIIFLLGILKLSPLPLILKLKFSFPVVILKNRVFHLTILMKMFNPAFLKVISALVNVISFLEKVIFPPVKVISLQMKVLSPLVKAISLLIHLNITPFLPAN